MPSPLSVVPAHIPPSSLSELTHTLFRTKNNPETILLINEEAIQEFPFQILLKTVWTSISVETTRHRWSGSAMKERLDSCLVSWISVLSSSWQSLSGLNWKESLLLKHHSFKYMATKYSEENSLLYVALFW